MSIIEKFGLTFKYDLPRYHRRWNDGLSVEGLIELLRDVKPIKMVEIGSGIGESTEIACQLVGQVYAVDKWEIAPNEVDGGHPLYQSEEIFNKRTNRFSNLVKVKLPSVEAAKTFRDQEFDLVYIDAAHELEDITEDIENWLPKVKLGGYISGHDYVWHPPVKQVVDKLVGPVKVYPDTSWLAQRII